MKTGLVHITVLQPVVSGDPTLEEWLAATVHMKTSVPFDVLWLLDEKDHEAHTICQRIGGGTIVDVREPRETEAPKMLKLIEGLKRAKGDVIIALDDDTKLADNTLERVVARLQESDVGLAFLLPCYTSFTNLWSRLVAYFVNANAFSTFVASEVVTGSAVMPGMFWAMKRSTVARLNDLEPFRSAIVDHEAISLAVEKLGMRLVLEPMTHDLSTTVPSARAYWRLMHRWFAYAKNGFLREMSAKVVAAGIVFGLGAAVLPVASLITSIVIRNPAPFLVVAASHWLLFAWVNARFLRGISPLRHSWLVIVVQLLLPFQIMAGLVLPAKLHWRGNLIELDGRGGFRFVARRSTSPM